MPCNKDDVCEKPVTAFYRNPIIIAPIIIAGGLGAGYLLFPESNDESSIHNRTIRKTLMFGGFLVGGVILTNHIMTNSRH
jgi:hypothetical protein